MRICVLFVLFSEGVVDVPYLVLEPTHNKQDFADGKVREDEQSIKVFSFFSQRSLSSIPGHSVDVN